MRRKIVHWFILILVVIFTNMIFCKDLTFGAKIGLFTEEEIVKIKEQINEDSKNLTAALSANKKEEVVKIVKSLGSVLSFLYRFPRDKESEGVDLRNSILSQFAKLLSHEDDEIRMVVANQLSKAGMAVVPKSLIPDSKKESIKFIELFNVGYLEGSWTDPETIAVGEPEKANKKIKIEDKNIIDQIIKELQQAKHASAYCECISRNYLSVVYEDTARNDFMIIVSGSGKNTHVTLICDNEHGAQFDMQSSFYSLIAPYLDNL